MQNVDVHKDSIEEGDSAADQTVTVVLVKLVGDKAEASAKPTQARFWPWPIMASDSPSEPMMAMAATPTSSTPPPQGLQFSVGSRLHGAVSAQPLSDAADSSTEGARGSLSC